MYVLVVGGMVYLNHQASVRSREWQKLYHNDQDLYVVPPGKLPTLKQQPESFNI